MQRFLKSNRFTLLIAMATLFALSGCDYSFTQPQSALDPKGPVARMQLEVMWYTWWVTGFLFLTVGGALLYTVWKFRAKKTDDPNFMPAQSHGNPLIEVGLIAVSALMLVIMGIPTVKGIRDMYIIPDEHNENVLEVNVTGYQWWWTFEYPELGVSTANEMVIPTGRTVKLNLYSADVIHSFWLPKLAGKTDLIPGQVNHMWIKADEDGKYWGQCAEYCGDSHAYMLFRAFAVPEDEFSDWVAKQKSPPAEPVTEAQALGQKLFVDKGCVGCHKIGDAGGVAGPILTHFGARSSLGAGWMENNRENLIRWIRHPETVKPGNLMYLGVGGMKGIRDIVKEQGLSDAETAALADYLLNLK